MIITIRKHPRRNKRKISIVKRHRRKIKKAGIITKDQRKIFDAMALQPVEIGGELDFGKNKKLERFTSFIGMKDYIDFPNETWEIEHHCHPGELLASPSPQDISGFLRSKGNQGMIVFSPVKATAIIKTKKVKIKPKKIENQLVKFYQKSKKLARQYKIPNRIIEPIYEETLNKKLRDTGFIIKTYKKGEKMNIPINVIE